MSERDIHSDVGISLCKICETSQQGENNRATDLAQAALTVAQAEIGGLPQRADCPRDGHGQPGCPLMKRYQV